MGYSSGYPRIYDHKHTDAFNDGGQLDLDETLFDGTNLFVWLIVMGGE